MATTTATITLASSDILSDSLSVSATSTLYKDASTSTGLDQVRMGRNEIPTGTSFDLIDATTLGVDKANKVYIANKSTDPTYYVTIVIDALTVGRLYAGDWMFVPYNASDGDAEIEVKGLIGTNKIEYAMFKTAWTLPAAES